MEKEFNATFVEHKVQLLDCRVRICQDTNTEYISCKINKEVNIVINNELYTTCYIKIHYRFYDWDNCKYIGIGDPYSIAKYLDNKFVDLIYDDYKGFSITKIYE